MKKNLQYTIIVSSGVLIAFLTGWLLAPAVFNTPRFISSIGSGPAPPVAVPDLVGLSRQDAQRQIETANLILAGQWAEFGSFETMGLVVRQNPLSGDLVPAGSPVNIFWDVGPLHRPFYPDTLIGLAATRAEELIADWQLYTAGRSRIAHPGFPEGTVIAVSPMQRGSLSVKTPVRLLISLGWHGIPLILGLDVAEAESLLSVHDLLMIVEQETVVIEPEKINRILNQSPAAGGSFSAGDTVFVEMGVRTGSTTWGEW